MGVYIKGMEMPISCAFCRFYGAYCYAKGDEDAHSTAPCPLIHVPPHGRLIDADALKETMKIITRTEVQEIVEFDRNAYKVDDAPTIIPAEETGMDSFIRIFEEDDEEDGMDSFIRILKD